MSNLLFLIMLISLITSVVFLGLYLIKRRKHDLRNTGIAFGLAVISVALVPATITPQQMAEINAKQAKEKEARQVAEAKAAQQKSNETVAKAQAAQKSPAQQNIPKQPAKVQESKPVAEFTSVEVRAVCELAAQRTLKLPDSARFPGVMDGLAPVKINAVAGKGYWESWIEGENSFGGRVRQYYSCTYDHLLQSADIRFEN